MDDDEIYDGEYAARADVAALHEALPPPEVLADGSTIFHATTATVGDELIYSWGTERPTADALGNKASLKALEGVSVLIEGHPPGNRGLVLNGDTGGRRRIGHVLSARFDAPSGRRIARFVVGDPKDAARAKVLRCVSEAYKARAVDGQQVTRRPNSLVVARLGGCRSPSAVVRVDTSGGIVTPEQLLAENQRLAGELAIAIANGTVETARADTAEAATVRVEAEHVTALETLATTHAAALVDAEARADTLASERAADMTLLQSRADTLGFEMPAEAKTSSAMRTALAVHLKCDAEQASNPIAAEAFIAGALAHAGEAGARVDTRTAAERFRDGGSNTDGNAPKPLPL